MPPLRSAIAEASSKLRFAMAAVGLVTTVLGCVNPAPGADKVKLGLPIPITVTDVGFTALGEDLGFFKEESIELDFVTLQGAAIVVPQVASKALLIGWPGPEPVLGSHERGKDPLPVKFFYNYIPVNPIELAVLADGPIKQVTDLRGKKVGTGALTWAIVPQTRALLKFEGLQVGKDVDLAAVGILGSGFHALRTGRVDALNYNHTWIDLLELQGTKVRRLAYKEPFASWVGNPFLAHVDTIKNNRDLLARFGRAMSKTTVACAANPEACVNAFWRRYPDKKPPSGDEKKNLADAVLLVQRRLAKMTALPPGVKGLGEFSPKAWKDYIEVLHAMGELNTKDIQVERLFTNELVVDFTKFDQQAVRRKAAEWK